MITWMCHLLDHGSEDVTYMDDGTAQLHVARTVQYAVRTRRVMHVSSVCQDVCSTT